MRDSWHCPSTTLVPGVIVKPWLPATLLCLVACGGSDAPDSAPTASLEPTRADSAGVALLSHAAGSLDRAPRIGVDSTPLAVIRGSVDDVEADISTIVPVLFLADGRLVGRDEQRQVIVVFSADGTQRQEFGRPGSGPGEFGALGGIIRGERDKLLIQDYRNSRLTELDPAEGPGAEYPMSDMMEAGGNTPIGMVNGKILAYGLNFSSSADDATPPGFKGVLFDPLTRSARRVFTTGPKEVEQEAPRVIRNAGGTALVAVMALRSPIRSLEAFPMAFGWGGRFVLADGNRFRFEWRDTTGALQQRLDVLQPRRAVTDQMWSAQVTQTLVQIAGGGSSFTAMGGATMSFRSTGAETPDTAAMRERMMADEHADSLAHFNRLEVTANGTLWVVDYPVPGAEGWAATAFGSDGRILGRIVEPKGDAPLVFGDDRVVFRSEDDLGIGTFTVRRLRFPG